jgi:hypothetical protein
MANWQGVLKQLKKEKKRAQKEAEKLEEAIATLGKLFGKSAARAGEKAVGRVQRTISAAGRKRIAAAQRARWAKLKKQALKKVT